MSLAPAVTGIDGYDWSLFGGNPIPGDPDAVRGIAARFSDLADNVNHQNSMVRSVGSDSESIWVGPAADKFRPHVGKLPGQLDKLTSSYRDAADGLNAYWPKLRSAQEMAVSALAKAKAAHGAILSAQSQVQSASANASSAAASSCCAAVLHSASAAGIQNPHHSWLSGIFDAVGSGFSSAWHWTQHEIKDATPVLSDISAGMGVATAVLAVASLALAPFGVGEALEVVNEGLIGLKTADDSLLLATGDKGAGAFLAEDAVALGTGGLGRVFADGGEALAAAGEAGEAGSRLAGTGEAVTAAQRGVGAATAEIAAAGSRADSAAADASLLRGLQTDAMAEGRTVDAVSFGNQAAMKDGELSAAQADMAAAARGSQQAQHALEEANAEAAAAARESTAAVANKAYADGYSPFQSPTAFTRSFSGLNSADKALALAKDPEASLAGFTSMNGLSGNAAQRFGQYYLHSVMGGPTAIGRLGGALKAVSIGVNVNEGVVGGQHLAAAASGGG